jgi:hypothetical protein
MMSDNKKKVDDFGRFFTELQSVQINIIQEVNGFKKIIEDRLGAVQDEFTRDLQNLDCKFDNITRSLNDAIN